MDISENMAGRKRKVDVYKTLKDAIQFLDFKPGSAVNEASLVAELGVSRTPIREALIRLSDEMLVDVFPQRGTYVSKINLKIAKEMAYMRHVMEMEICIDLCKNQADLSNLTGSTLHAMEYTIKQQDIVSYIKLDNEFHRLLFSVNGHEPIWNIISNTRAHYIRFLMLDMGFPNSLEESYLDHQRIVEYILNGNKNELKKLLDAHHDHMTMKRESQIRKNHPEFIA